MIKALPPPSYSRTAEILSRYRPIAPKPYPLPINGGADKIQQSPHPRTVLPQQLHARPARKRKRGRVSSISTTTATSLSSSKRHRSAASPAHAAPPAVPPPHGHVFGLNHEEPGPGMNARSLVTLSLLLGLETGSSMSDCLDFQKEGVVTGVAAEVLEEKDLLQQLQVPHEISNKNNSAPVISPRPVRPVWSSIFVGCMTAVKDLPLSTRKAEEVEEEVESEALPAVISDSNGRVRLANSSYKEMVGQPECPWLDSVMTAGGNSRRMRISGDVILRFWDETTAGLVEKKAVGFRCWVRIEWGKTSVNTVCDVRRLCCESKDYLFYWRFHVAAPITILLDRKD